MVALRRLPASVDRHLVLDRRRVAVVLNVNARKVDGEALRWVQAVVPRKDVFVSRSVADGTLIADRIVAAGYHAVLWGGGDGTFSAGVAALADSAERRGVELPDVGVLRLGTGNAVATAVGASPASPEGVAVDVQRARRAAGRRQLQMLSVEDRPTVFAGFGLDAQILDDFRSTVAMLERLKLADRMKSAGWRYFLAVAGRSVPRFIAAQRAEVVAINRGSPALRVDVEGRQVGAPIPAGRVMWRGLASLASAASIPYYGLGMKMFPHAERLPGRFQVRLSDAGTAEALAHLPAIWVGRYQGEHIHDFLVDDVELVLARPAPFQSGGDLVGLRSRVRITMWDRPVAVV